MRGPLRLTTSYTTRRDLTAEVQLGRSLRGSLHRSRAIARGRTLEETCLIYAVTPDDDRDLPEARIFAEA